jgi:hypothetical protein
VWVAAFCDGFDCHQLFESITTLGGTVNGDFSAKQPVFTQLLIPRTAKPRQRVRKTPVLSGHPGSRSFTEWRLEKVVI